MLQSLKRLYIQGPGPSSSHTIGPYKAAIDFLESEVTIEKLPLLKEIEVTLYGSLALTGKGHLTDKIIKDTLKESLDKNIENSDNIEILIKFDIKKSTLKHPNTMKFKAYFKGENIEGIKATYYSIGGGEILKNSLEKRKKKFIYPFSSFNEIVEYCNKNNITDLKDLVDKYEDKDIDNYLYGILNIMINSVKEGLTIEGKLPGKLSLDRIAKRLYENTLSLSDSDNEKIMMLLTSFAYAVAENNASGKIVVTSPTCGSSGIIPSILYYFKYYKNESDKRLIDSLKVASIFGNLAKENATISGAVGGCQAEIGVASSMGAAIFAYLYNLSIYQIEYAAELALEHFLGLTCDPVEGYVQIPCIERNGIGVLRSYSAALYAKNIALIRKNRVTFDEVLKTMKLTGDDLSIYYKETSIGGLAKIKKLEE